MPRCSRGHGDAGDRALLGARANLDREAASPRSDAPPAEFALGAPYGRERLSDWLIAMWR